MKGHPVFIPQHATATCCRGCILKWHGIEKGRALNEVEVDYVVALIIRRFFEKGAVGEIKEAPCQASIFTWLLGEILNIRFIPPDISPKLRTFYESHICRVLNTSFLDAVAHLVGEMEREGLFNRQFVEFFRYQLAAFAKKL